MSAKVTLPDGQDIAYDVRERGSVPVVQLHGLTSSRARDVVLGLDFTATIGGVRALRYDAPGHGESVVPSVEAATPTDFLWGRMANVLLEMLDWVFPGEGAEDGDTDASESAGEGDAMRVNHPVGAEGKPKVIGIGQSMGAATLLTAALEHPERFSGLILCIPPTIWDVRQAQSYQYRRFAELVEQHGMDMFGEAANSSPLPPAVNPDRPETDPDVDVALLPTLYRGAGMTDLPDEIELGKLDLPVLILAWIDDPSHPMWSAEALLDALPNATMEVAETPADVEAWPARMETFIQEHGLSAFA